MLIYQRWDFHAYPPVLQFLPEGNFFLLKELVNAYTELLEHIPCQETLRLQRRQGYASDVHGNVTRGNRYSFHDEVTGVLDPF